MSSNVAWAWGTSRVLSDEQRRLEGGILQPCRDSAFGMECTSPEILETSLVKQNWASLVILFNFRYTKTLVVSCSVAVESRGPEGEGWEEADLVFQQPQNQGGCVGRVQRWHQCTFHLQVLLRLLISTVLPQVPAGHGCHAGRTFRPPSFLLLRAIAEEISPFYSNKISSSLLWHPSVVTTAVGGPCLPPEFWLKDTQGRSDWGCQSDGVFSSIPPMVNIKVPLSAIMCEVTVKRCCLRSKNRQRIHV